MIMLGGKQEQQVFPIEAAALQMGELFGIDSVEIARQAGLSLEALQSDGATLTAEQYGALFDTLEKLCDMQTLPLIIARAMASTPLTGVLLAFSASKTVGAGITNFARYGVLLGPTHLRIQQSGDRCELYLTHAARDFELHEWVELTTLLQLLECCRRFSNRHIVPLAMQVRGKRLINDAVIEHVGVEPTEEQVAALILDKADLDHLLLTANSDILASMETYLQKRLQLRVKDMSLSAQIKLILQDILPNGETSIEDVALRLNLGTRSIQRRLSEENQTFSSLLQETRKSLAMHYLLGEGLRNEEISILLGYREPNSFFKAFQNWTGMTPAEIRKTKAEAL
ncbi:helix-turn-helix domain-containing protein [Ciceribacter lividus]|nr:AraC family transcriptional regulator [Ciceribacter lividus]